MPFWHRNEGTTKDKGNKDRLNSYARIILTHKRIFVLCVPSELSVKNRIQADETAKMLLTHKEMIVWRVPSDLRVKK